MTLILQPRLLGTGVGVWLWQPPRRSGGTYQLGISLCIVVHDIFLLVGERGRGTLSSGSLEVRPGSPPPPRAASGEGWLGPAPLQTVLRGPHRLQGNVVPQVSPGSSRLPDPGPRLRAAALGAGSELVCLQRQAEAVPGSREDRETAESRQERNEDSARHLPIPSIKKPAHYGHVLINYL